MIMRYENATIEIDKRRWNAYITITQADGSQVKLVASADSGVTYSDGLFLDTEDEFERVSGEGW